MFWDIFFHLCEIRGEKPSQVVNKLNIGAGNVTAWKRGTLPSTKSLEKISDYFGVSVAYLLGKEPNRFELSEHEKELITAYRQQPEMQSAVDRILGILQKEKEQSIG